MRMLQTPPPSWAKWQKVINAVEIPPRDQFVDAPAPIPVVARIVWGTDGEEWVPGEAIRWTGTAVLVELRDPRSETLGPWLAPDDVRRR